MGKSRWYRLALSIFLLVAIFWLWSSRFDELIYHTVASSELIELGDATTFEAIKDQVKPNSYVSVSGILGNKAATLTGLRAGSFRVGRFQVRNLLGSKLYIEYNEKKYHDHFKPFTRVSVSGRLVPFGPKSELEKVRKFFSDYYKKPVDDKAMLIVVDEMPKGQLIYTILFLVSAALLLYSFISSIRGFLRAKN